MDIKGRIKSFLSGKPYNIPNDSYICPECDGTGMYDSFIECQVCDGRRYLTQEEYSKYLMSDGD
ncbi:hypothetical protein [Bacillus massilinigeriensis]|uniref:hypothetical protein n=1 Tax=Bacillus mediterraneensis TaxID=1805474 RepID=UPI0008F932BE|nr:hypothetical protein [Bacillus mediterraneensis]